MSFCLSDVSKYWISIQCVNHDKTLIAPLPSMRIQCSNLFHFINIIRWGEDCCKITRCKYLWDFFLFCSRLILVHCVDMERFLNSFPLLLLLGVVFDSMISIKCMDDAIHRTHCSLALVSLVIDCCWTVVGAWLTGAMACHHACHFRPDNLGQYKLTSMNYEYSLAPLHMPLRAHILSVKMVARNFVFTLSMRKRMSDLWLINLFHGPRLGPLLPKGKSVPFWYLNLACESERKKCV